MATFQGASTGMGIERVPTTGGQGTTIASAYNGPRQFVLDDGCVYWSEQGAIPLNAAIMKAPR